MSDFDATIATDAADGAQQPQTEVVSPDGIQAGKPEAAEPAEPGEEAEPAEEAVTQPGKVMRIGSMIKQLLEEVRNSSLDEASRERLAEVYERSVIELSTALSPDLQDELRLLALPFDHDDVPSEAELRVAKAQLVGWLEGLFHGIQASLMAQHAMAQAQVAQQQRAIGDGMVSGTAIPGQQPGQHVAQQPDRPGTYL